jgi:hypothetical protein
MPQSPGARSDFFTRKEKGLRKSLIGDYSKA